MEREDCRDGLKIKDGREGSQNKRRRLTKGQQLQRGESSNTRACATYNVIQRPSPNNTAQGCQGEGQCLLYPINPNHRSQRYNFSINPGLIPACYCWHQRVTIVLVWLGLIGFPGNERECRLIQAALLSGYKCCEGYFPTKQQVAWANSVEEVSQLPTDVRKARDSKAVVEKDSRCRSREHLSS